MEGFKRNKLNCLSYIMISCLFGLIFTITVSQVFYSEIWRSVATGRYILQTKTIPHENIFSFVPYQGDWINYSWLAEIIFYKISLFGFYWLNIFRAGLITLTFVVVFKTVYNRTNNQFIALFITTISSFISIIEPAWMDRPPLFSFFFMAIYVFILSEYKYTKKDHLWWIPLIMLFWVNTHILFILGFVALFIYFIGESVKTFLITRGIKWDNKNKDTNVISFTPKQIYKLSKIILLTLFISLLNPYTYHIFIQVFEYTNKGYIWMIDPGLQSCDFARIEILLFERLLFFCIIAICFSSQSLDLTSLLIFLFFTHHVLRASREVPFFCIIVPGFLAVHFKYFFSDMNKNLKKILNFSYYIKKPSTNFFNKLVTGFFIALFLGVIVAIIKIIPLSSRTKIFAEKETSPFDAVNFIENNHLQPNMFNVFDWGGYLIYRLYPQYKVSADFRIQLYSESFWEDYFKVSKCKNGWQEVLNKYEVNFIFWERRSPLYNVLMENKNWKLIYQDELAVIFIRDMPENDKFLSIENLNKLSI